MQQRRKIKLSGQLIIAGIIILFGSADAYSQRIWDSNMFRCPVTTLARRQVVRQLGRLSNNLHDLASDKQDLSEVVANGSNADIRARIEDFEETSRRLRRNINRLVELFPAPDRQRGAEVGNQLFQWLVEKNELLQSARQRLNGGQITSDQLRGDLERGRRLILGAKSDIDILMIEIENKPCPN